MYSLQMVIRITKPNQPPLEAVVITMHDDPTTLRPLIEKRIALATRLAGLQDGALLQMSDGAYETLANLTGGNPAHALYIFREVVRDLEREAAQPPYMVTVEDIQRHAVSREQYGAIHRSGLRDVAVFTMPERKYEGE
jgi:hypothetical protein